MVANHYMSTMVQGLRSPVFSLPETQVPSENTPGRYHGAKSPDTSTTTSICQLVDNTSQVPAVVLHTTRLFPQIVKQNCH